MHRDAGPHLDAGVAPIAGAGASSPAAVAIRQDVIRACKILDGLRLVEGFGHVSARLPDGGMLITPARGLALARESELLTIGPDGSCLHGDPSSAPLERWMHLAIYRARPDVGAICRTHSRMAAALGVAREPLRAMHGFGGMLGLEVPLYDGTDLITDDGLGQAVAASLGDRTALLLRGNGALITGEGVPQACIRAVYLEEAAWMHVVSEGIGGGIPFTSEELRARSRWYAVEVSRAWEYYTNKFASDPMRPG
ncbi:MAG TPA: class II aldolase/adducin family protein [Vicinamibacteria bacterium]|nr:class II aldolase/adducin family protein [Vicinamibacteria bacterium]